MPVISIINHLLNEDDEKKLHSYVIYGEKLPSYWVLITIPNNDAFVNGQLRCADLVELSPSSLGTFSLHYQALHSRDRWDESTYDQVIIR